MVYKEIECTLREFTEDNAKEVCLWKYPEPWDVYNMPSWEEVLEHHWDMSDPEKRENEFIAFYQGDYFIGYGRIYVASKYVLLGIGLKPELCGHGHGNMWFPILAKKAFEKFPHQEVALEVRAFNSRAIQCYQKYGFEIVGLYERDTHTGHDLFYFMKYQDDVS